jgi:spore coat protein U-like protein
MRKILSASLLAASLAAVGGANAGTTTTTFPVTATVATNCLVSATALGFGTYTQGAGNVNQTSTVNVNCSLGTGFNVGLNAGSTPAATVTTRKMLNGANQLAYTLYSDAARSVNWGNTVGTNTVPGTGAGFGAGNVVALTVYGQVPDSAANQGVPAGNYTDTVLVTVTF